MKHTPGPWGRKWQAIRNDMERNTGGKEMKLEVLRDSIEGLEEKTVQLFLVEEECKEEVYLKAKIKGTNKENILLSFNKNGSVKSFYLSAPFNKLFEISAFGGIAVRP